MRRIWSVGALVLAILVLALPNVPSAEAALECQPKKLKAISNAATKFRIMNKPSAQGLAKQAWVNRCTRIYADNFCNIHRAKDGRFICNMQPSGFGDFAHTCEYEAYPCRNK